MWLTGRARHRFKNMEPINKKEIYTAQRNFVMQFVLVLLFMLFGVFLYIKAADKEYLILREKHDEVENLMASRIEINRQFASINQNFKALNQYTSNLSDVAKKQVLQTDIERSIGEIERILRGIQSSEDRASITLYRKLNKDVSLVSRLQDSLYTTKNMIESKRLQLNSCLEQNNRASARLSRGSLLR